jgi:hypothetical protein
MASLSPKDFRIGNLLQDKLTGTILYVEGLTETNIVFQGIPELTSPLPNGWQAEPIPLTYALLLKLGFIDPTNNGWGCRLSLDSVDEICWYRQDPGFLSHQTKDSGFARKHKIKFLHQFQNFCHSILGVDIQIQFKN